MPNLFVFGAIGLIFSLFVVRAIKSKLNEFTFFLGFLGSAELYKFWLNPVYGFPMPPLWVLAFISGAWAGWLVVNVSRGASMFFPFVRPFRNILTGGD